MKSPTHPGCACPTVGRVQRATLCAAWLALLAGCDAGSPPPDSAAGAQPMAAAHRAATLPQAGVQTSPADGQAALPSSAAAAAPLRWELQPLGEIERPDGLVERSYRVNLHNGAQPLPQLLAVAAPAVAGVQVQQGVLVLGDVAAGAVRSARGPLTLVHAADWVPESGDLQWTLRPDAALYAHGGALLPGAPEGPATAGLRDWHPPLAAGWRLQAQLSPQARLADANEVLLRQRLRIAQMRPGNHMLTLHPVGSASEAAMKHAVQALPASGAFVVALLLPPPAMAGAGQDPDAADSAAEPFPCDQ